MSQRYAGDVTPNEAWNILEKENTYLVDCRTAAEWSFVGVPDISMLGKDTIFAEWVKYPGGIENPDFVNEVKKTGINTDATVLFLCRSGQRSQEAAAHLNKLGYRNCYNISDGFEGYKDSSSHRASVNGWKYNSLPWKQ